MKNLICLFLITFLTIGMAMAQETAPAKPIAKEKVEIPEKAMKSEGEVFKVVDEMPRFPGCEDMLDENKRKQCANKKMLEYVYRNIKYPAEAKANNEEGTVVIRFIIGADGTILEPAIVKNIGEGSCGEEALRIVNSMNNMPEKWIPGKQRGENVDVYFNLPVKFRL